MALEGVVYSTSYPDRLTLWKKPPVSTEQDVRGLQSQSGRSEGEKNFLHLPEITPGFPNCLDHNPVSISTMLHCFPFTPNNDGKLNNVDIKREYYCVLGMTPCSLVETYQQVIRTCCVQLLGISSSLKMDSAGTSEMLNCYQITRCHRPDDSYSHNSENLKSHIKSKAYMAGIL
jgi:hypothetical protein